MGVSEAHIREWQAMMERRLAALAEQIPPPPPRPVLPEAQRKRSLVVTLTEDLVSGATADATANGATRTITVYSRWLESGMRILADEEIGVTWYDNSGPENRGAYELTDCLCAQIVPVE